MSTTPQKATTGAAATKKAIMLRPGLAFVLSELLVLASELVTTSSPSGFCCCLPRWLHLELAALASSFS